MTTTTPGGALTRSFTHPRGLLGRLAGHVMALENRETNHIAVRALAPDPADRVIEVGSGPGRALAELAGLTDRGFVAGVDPSPEMVAQASRRVRGAIDAGRAQVVVAPAERLPYRDGEFTGALTVHSIDHWDDPAAGLAELARVLVPGGRLVVVLRVERGSGRDPHAHGATERDLQELTRALGEAGFAGVEVRRHRLRRETLAVVSALGRGASRAHGSPHGDADAGQLTGSGPASTGRSRPC